MADEIQPELDAETLKRIEEEVQAKFAAEEPQLDEETLRQIEAQVNADFDTAAIPSSPIISDTAETIIQIPPNSEIEMTTLPIQEQQFVQPQQQFVQPQQQFVQPQQQVEQPPQQQVEQPQQFVQPQQQQVEQDPQPFAQPQQQVEQDPQQFEETHAEQEDEPIIKPKRKGNAKKKNARSTKVNFGTGAHKQRNRSKSRSISKEELVEDEFIEEAEDAEDAEETTRTRRGRKEEKKSKTGLIIGIVALVAIVIGVVLFFVLKGGTPKTETTDEGTTEGAATEGEASNVETKKKTDAEVAAETKKANKISMAMELTADEFREKVLKLINSSKTEEAKELIAARKEKNPDETDVNYKLLEKRLKQAE
jgi:hypothetical protein